MTMHKPSIAVGGKIIEVGRDAGGNNEIVFETDGKPVRLIGVSDGFAKFAAQNLYESVLVSMELM